MPLTSAPLRQALHAGMPGGRGRRAAPLICNPLRAERRGGGSPHAAPPALRRSRSPAGAPQPGRLHRCPRRGAAGPPAGRAGRARHRAPRPGGGEEGDAGQSSPMSRVVAALPFTAPGQQPGRNRSRSGAGRRRTRCPRAPSRAHAAPRADTPPLTLARPRPPLARAPAARPSQPVLRRPSRPSPAPGSEMARGCAPGPTRWPAVPLWNRA